ncbi:MAG: YedE-related selenium metabolism membrane protein [Clostridia bacterium]|nr:YedE-related selenium metabolism membrane protein [Clostridia bacterium]
MLDKNKILLIISGVLVGVIAVVLTLLGNPANMGFCIACFIRDTAGAVKLHTAAVVQYVRPEIIGIALGAFIISLAKKEFQPRGGSAPVIRFVLGFGVMVGALMFLGCPLRMSLRIAGGDLNAIVGLAGFAIGILAGVFFLNKGFSLGRSFKQRTIEGVGFSAISIIMLVLLVAIPSILVFSTEGPGSMRAPIIASLIAGLAVGILSQRTRFCMMGGIRDVYLFRDWTLLSGFIALIVAALIGNVIVGSFKPGFAGQAIAHTDGLWNFLGMFVVGLGSVMLGGCPLRQLVLAGEGNTDSAIAIFGMLVGAAFCHNFSLASSGSGSTVQGRIAVCIVLAVMIVIGVCNLERSKK